MPAKYISYLKPLAITQAEWLIDVEFYIAMNCCFILAKNRQIIRFNYMPQIIPIFKRWVRC